MADEVIHDIQIFDLGIQTRRILGILGIHCDSGDLTHFTNIFADSCFYIYFKPKGFNGIQGAGLQTNVIAYKIAGSL